MRVLIVGGGVIGMAAAYELVRAGAGVVVVDSGLVGQATSRGNAGWIVPSMSGPLPSPGTVAQGFRWMFRADSPLLIRPRLDPRLLGWLWSFWRASRTSYHTGVDAMIPFARDSVSLFEEYLDAGLCFELRHGGLLLACRTERQLEKEWCKLELLRAHGYDAGPRMFDSTSLVEHEPALSDDLFGGVLIPGEGYVEPVSLVTALAAAVAAEGGEIIEGTRVVRLRRTGDRWTAETARGAIVGDRVLVAAGFWSRGLLASIGVRIPLEAGKGYSITTAGSGTPPSLAVGFMEAKVACSPFTGGVRLAGTMELGRPSLTLSRSRLEPILRSASGYLRDWRPTPTREEWAGLRALTPDGLPVIGAVPGVQGVVVATGHGPLGVTLAPATARGVVPLLLDGETQAMLEPFRLERFHSR